MLVPHCQTIVESPLLVSFTVVDNVLVEAIVVDGVPENLLIPILFLSILFICYYIL